MDINITLSPDESDILFKMKKEAGADDLTAQEYAQHLMVDTIKGYRPAQTARNEYIKGQLEDITLDVGGDLENIHALLRLYEDHAATYKAKGLPSDLTGDFVSLVVRFLSSIETNMKELEKVTELLTA